MYTIVEMYKWLRDDDFEVNEVYWPFTSYEMAEKYKNNIEKITDRKEWKYQYHIKEWKNIQKNHSKKKEEKFFNYILKNIEKTPENHWVVLFRNRVMWLSFKIVKKSNFWWIHFKDKHKWWLFAFYYHKWINVNDEHIVIYNKDEGYDYFKKEDNKKDWDKIKWKKVLTQNIEKISLLLL